VPPNTLDVDALLEFASSRHGLEAHPPPENLRAPRTRPHDHLIDSSEAATWLRPRKALAVPSGRPTARELTSLREVRGAVLALAARDRAGYRRRVKRLLSGRVYAMRLDGRPIATERGWSGFVARLLVPLIELQSVADRVKRCDNALCEWVFLDRSPGRTRRWCEMKGCGNRLKVRAYRARRR